MLGMKVRQLTIVHLSDVHFGAKHRFEPARTSAGDQPNERNYPSLLDKLQEDLAEEAPGCPVVVVISGDLAQIGSYEEFEKAEDFVRGLTKGTLLGVPCPLPNIFLVPGNHDVAFDSDKTGERWQRWVDLNNRLRNTSVDRDRPWDLEAVEDRLDDLGAIVATLNSAAYVQKGTEDAVRGRLDNTQIERLKRDLETIESDRLESAIRIAIIHHHPVLIPDLVEADHNYDAIHNSANLLTVLREFGFHLLLHGHKHNPHVFTEDSLPAYPKGDRHPILIVAGGSVGSTELPERCGNCYNRIDVKWNPNAEQTRIRVRTRGLRIFDENDKKLMPGEWEWCDVRVDDRQFIEGEEIPVAVGGKAHDFDETADGDADARRSREYRRVNFYFPVAAVMPSLQFGQVNEVRLWMVRHELREPIDRGPSLACVTWSAGPRFEVITVRAEEDRSFCATLHYYGPMLVQAAMKFEDGSTEDAYIYIRLPEALGSP